MTTQTNTSLRSGRQRILTVRVGHSEGAAAEYFLHDQNGIDDFFSTAPAGGLLNADDVKYGSVGVNDFLLGHAPS